MTILFTHPSMLEHRVPGGHPEHEGRLEAVLAGLAPLGLARREAPLAPRAALERVHTRAYLDLVEAATAPGSGLSALDPDTFVSERSREAALRAAGAVIAGVDAVLDGPDTTAFCAVRPPGHHAEADQAMGFCVYNNVAVGAMHALYARGLANVAVVDFDVHHGNGTQSLAEREPRLFFASTHQWPHYPGSGGPGSAGAHVHVVNVPLPAGTEGATWRAAMEAHVMPALEAFGADLILVSAGFDAHGADPLADLALGEDDYAWAGRRLRDAARGHAQGRIVSTLEGGYDLNALTRSSAAFVSAMMGDAGGVRRTRPY